MAETITAVYEKGVLRPLTPLALPESSRVEIQIMGPAADPQDERQQVRQALQDAGLVRRQPATQPVKVVSEAQLAAAADSLAQAGPLSQLIIDERNGR
jgi:predicted DNA-binding antitoxin AbrB/MazE fold protein